MIGVRKPVLERTRLARGFGLVELMIGLSVGLVVVLIATSLLLSNLTTYKSNDDLIRIQEGVRAAFELMARDIREAGQTPCGARNVANVLRSDGSIPAWADWASGAVRGFDSTQAVTYASIGTANTERVDGTDAILVLNANQTQSTVVSHDAGTAVFTLQSAAGFEAGDLAVACDAQSGALFEIGAADSTADTITYTTDLAPLNCSTNLSFEGSPTPVSCTGYSARTFESGGVLAKLSSHLWYVGFNGHGGKSLYRATVAKDDSGEPTVTYVEMISDVQNLQLDYVAYDMSTAIPTLGTTWINATDVDDWSLVTSTELPVAVRVKLTFQTQSTTDGTKLEKTLSAIVGLRNRELVQ